MLRAESAELRPLSAEQLESAVGTAGDDALFRVEWTTLPGADASAGQPPTWAVARSAADVTALAEGSATAAELPAFIVLEAVVAHDQGAEDPALALTNRVLAAVQTWLAAPPWSRPGWSWRPGRGTGRCRRRGDRSGGRRGVGPDPGRAVREPGPDAAPRPGPALDPDPSLPPGSAAASDLAANGFLDRVLGRVAASGGEPELALRGETLSIPGSRVPSPHAPIRRRRNARHPWRWTRRARS
ncbi:hypothetical protein NKH77_33920 [Streptomyces sp. M19]